MNLLFIKILMIFYLISDSIMPFLIFCQYCIFNIFCSFGDICITWVFIIIKSDKTYTLIN